MKKSKDKEEEKTEEEKVKKVYPPRRKRKYRFTPSWYMPIVPSEVVTEEAEVRRLEYLNAISDLSGSNEGHELESLSNLSHEQFKKHRYERDEWEPEIGDFD